jgi:hypothetical protein
MPTYDYHCPANGRTVKVSHKLADRGAPVCGGGSCAYG